MNRHFKLLLLVISVYGSYYLLFKRTQQTQISDEWYTDPQTIQTAASIGFSSNPEEDHNPFEGINCYNRKFIKAKGSTKTIVLFVDFEDYPAHSLTTQQLSERINRKDTLSKIYHKLSRGSLEIEPLEFIHEWKRMPFPSTHWTNGEEAIGPKDPRNYCSAAFGLYPEVDFSNYDIAIIVPSKVNELLRSPTHFLVPTPSYSKIGVITCGKDLYSTKFPGKLLAHEYGHQYGLPDLYFHSNNKYQDRRIKPAVGPWDIMANVYSANSMLGWNQYYLEWLEKNRMTLLNEFEWNGLLTPIFSNNGTSLIIVPKNPKNRGKLSQFYCIEKVQDLDITQAKEEGILIYYVDTNIPSGHYPIQLISDNKASIYQSSFDDPSIEHAELPFKVNILGKSDRGTEIEILPSAMVN